MDKDEFKRIREDIFSASQYEFALLINMSHSSVQHFEGGRRQIPQKVERRLRALIEERKRNTGNSIQQGKNSKMSEVQQSVSSHIAGTEAEKIMYLEQLLEEKDKQIKLLERMLEMKNMK